MKNILILALGAIALAGCSSYCELSRGVPANANIDDDIKPIASYVVCNNQYKLLGLVPLSTGVTWKDGAYADRREFNAKWFEDRCTLDENLASVKAALRECKTDRLCNLVTTEDSSWMWSLFTVRMYTIKTTCLICEPKAK